VIFAVALVDVLEGAGMPAAFALDDDRSVVEMVVCSNSDLGTVAVVDRQLALVCYSYAARVVVVAAGPCSHAAAEHEDKNGLYRMMKGVVFETSF